jgi:murein DD-endopeptidase MepM/ murein hydrolase activator NlpD
MALNPPSGIVKWYNTPLGERGWNSFRAQLTGKDYPGASRKTSYVRLSDKEADEVISNIKKDPEGIPIFDEANAPDKAEEYQRWLVARYLTKAREEGFESRKKEATKQLEEELGPEGLDELLNLIREESAVEVGAGAGRRSSPRPPSSSALAVSPKKLDDFVEEDIDPQILSILGLEDVFDLTYEEYYRELRTAAAAGRMPGSQMSTGTIELVTAELKRVKGKTGRFIVKPKKVDINKVLDRKQPAPSSAIVKAQKLIPSVSDIFPDQDQKSKVDSGKLQEDLLDGIGNILESLITIRTFLQNQSKTEQREAELDRRDKEKKKKKAREAKLESKRSSGIFDKALEKVQKPFISFFDRVKQFFLSILTGGAIEFLLNVINDPQILLKPLQDLVNNIIGFFNNIITWIDNTLIQPLRNVINSINNSIKNFVNGVNNNLSRIPSWIYRHTPIQAPQLPNVPNLPRIPLATFAQPVQTQTTGGQVVHVNQISFKGGGPITPDSGIRIAGLGKDTQLIAAQPGEVMINKAAADSVGVENLLTLNSFYGGPGANKPGMAALGDIQTMSSGGYAGKIKYFSSNGGGNKILNPGQTYKYSDLRSHHSGSNTKRTDGYPRDYTLLHGTNLASSPNADIPVPLESEVIFKAPAGGYGNTVVVKNQTGNMLFGHLSKFGNFKVGDKIKAGTIIGTQGKTGGNYVDHLHIDANPAGHEAFVNFITSGKPTFGSTSSASGESPGQSSSGMETTPPATIDLTPDEHFVPLDQLKTLYGDYQTINGVSNIMQNIIPNNSATVSTPGQAPVPSFSSEDPFNVTNLVIRSIYNLIG